MNRRDFLKGAGFIGFLAFLQACRLANVLEESAPAARVSTSMPTNAPTTTPTSTAVPTTPPVSTTVPAPPNPPKSPPATPTPVPEATVPADPPPPVSTPTPSPTPTPTPTPYPPGPPSKLGLFVTRFHPEVLSITEAGRPALLKTLEIDGNYVQGLKESSPTTRIVGRIQLGPHNLDVDQGPLIQDFVDKLLPLATDPKRMAAIEAWEAYNEPVADTPDRMKRLAEFEAERTRLLAEQGIRSVVGNFATGNPPLELWPEFRPALEAIDRYDGYLGLHEYSAPTMQFMAGANQLPGEPDQGDEGWLTLRYRKVYRHFLGPMGLGDTPLLITECGVDGLVQPRPGPPEAEGWLEFIPTWRELGFRDDPPGVYMDQLIWYDQNLQQDSFVKGAAIFLAGSNTERWNTYDILNPRAGRMGQLLTQYLRVHPPDGEGR